MKEKKRWNQCKEKIFFFVILVSLLSFESLVMFYDKDPVVFFFLVLLLKIYIFRSRSYFSHKKPRYCTSSFIIITRNAIVQIVCTGTPFVLHSFIKLFHFQLLSQLYRLLTISLSLSLTLCFKLPSTFPTNYHSSEK